MVDAKLCVQRLLFWLLFFCVIGGVVFLFVQADLCGGCIVERTVLGGHFVLFGGRCSS